MNSELADDGLCPMAQSLAGPHGPGEPARDRLLLAGLHLFAEQGYAKTSIRQIAHAAGANVAAVSYYFGNKAGLYRAVFWGGATPVRTETAAGGAAAANPLENLFEHILAPLRSGDKARLWVKLHRREMIEPAGLWQEKVDRGMQPMHAALVAYLCRRLGVDRADDEVLALAALVIGPAVHLLVNCEVVDALAPQLLAAPDSVDVWRGRLLRSAETLIAAERERRRARTKKAPAAKRPARAAAAAGPAARAAKKKNAPTKPPASRTARTRSRT